MESPSMPAIIILLVKDKVRVEQFFDNLKSIFQDSEVLRFEELITNERAVQFYLRRLWK